MPFPGIPEGSELESNIDRCLESVMAKQPDIDKSAAIAICRDSIPGASKKECSHGDDTCPCQDGDPCHYEGDNPMTATKDRADALKLANYRSAGPASTQVCQTCIFADNSNRHCGRWEFTFDNEYICDSWQPDIPALQARGRELAAEEPEAKAATGTPSPITAHGPGGLFSQPIGARGHGRLKDLYMNIIESIKQWFSAEMPNLDIEISEREVPEVKSTFKVITGKDGLPRWVAISSNAFMDRDGEIVSTKALGQAVGISDDTGERGPLRFWHVPGWDIGNTDFQMMHGRMLIESGQFLNEDIGQRIAQKSHDLDLSIGFKHPATEPDAEGVFHNINIFERSLVPKGRAANLFTSLTVKEQSMSNIDEKQAAFRELLGDEAEEIIQQAESTQKEAEQTTTYKEAEEPTHEQLMELWNAHKETETEQEDDPEPELDSPSFDDQFNALNQRIDSIAEAVSGLVTATKETREKVDILADEQPRALKSGFRATQSDSTLTGEINTDEATTMKEIARRRGMGAASMIPIAEKLMGGIKGHAPQ